MIDYEKHWERIVRNEPGFTYTDEELVNGLLYDAAELLDKAEERDKAIERVDELGMALAQIHASIATGSSLPDGMSILEFIAKVVNSEDPASVEEGKVK